MHIDMFVCASIELLDKYIYHLAHIITQPLIQIITGK